jgi:RNA polymerase sigma-70 factor, ECF subfamily
MVGCRPSGMTKAKRHAMSAYVSREIYSDQATSDWLRAARDGSREAMGKLLEACRAYLLLVANRELDADLRAKAGASDLVQETFLESHRNFARFKGNTEAELLAWLRHLLLDNVSKFERRYRATGKRRIARELSLSSPSRAGGESVGGATTATPSWHAVANEQAAALELAITRLPIDCARVIVLVHRESLSFVDAAHLMNRSVDSVRRIWGRAVELLADELDKSNGDR